MQVKYRFKWVQTENLCCNFGDTPLKIGESAETVAKTGEIITGVCLDKGTGPQLEIFVVGQDNNSCQCNCNCYVQGFEIFSYKANFNIQYLKTR